MTHVRSLRCARCKRSYWSIERGSFHCPTCERNARDNVDAIHENRKQPAPPATWRR